jgi:hypothetical protein
MTSASDGKGPANADSVKKWKDKYKLNSSNVVSGTALNPGSSNWSALTGGKGIGTPSFLVVDPRTLTVMKFQQGAGGTLHSFIEQLAKKNSTTSP